MQTELFQQLRQYVALGDWLALREGRDINRAAERGPQCFGYGQNGSRRQQGILRERVRLMKFQAKRGCDSRHVPPHIGTLLRENIEWGIAPALLNIYGAQQKRTPAQADAAGL